VAIKAAALTIVLSLGATQAMAQPGYYYGGEPAYDVGPMQGLSMRQITRVVRSAGLRPIAQPRRIGRNYIVSSVDRHGVVKRVVIDARMGEIVAVRAARGPIGRGERVTFKGPDADTSWFSESPPRPHARIPGVRSPAKADRNKDQKKNAVASVPPAAEAAAPEKAPAHEPDTESLPKAEGTVTLPSSGQPEQAAKPEQKPEATASVPSEPAAAPSDAPKAAPATPAATRSATVTPAKPPLPVRRPAAAPQPAVAKPDDSAKAATPTSSPRVVLPGGPPTAKDETTASSSASGSKQSAEPKAADAPPASISIVPAQSYE
jgi:hypothetical protein